MEDLRENCPFESFGRIPGKQLDSGRRFLSLLSFSLSLASLVFSLLRYISLFLMAALCVSFLALGFNFLLRFGLSLFLSPRLLLLLVWRCPSYTRTKPHLIISHKAKSGSRTSFVPCSFLFPVVFRILAH